VEKRTIKIYKSFEDLHKDRLQEIMNSTLQERWDAFWNLQKLHNQLMSEKYGVDSVKKKRTITISKPDWDLG
jgi:hypothetical protein